MNQHSSTESSTSADVAPDAVSRRAYELWEAEGRPEGNDMRHWLQAEQELAKARNAATATERSPAAPARDSDVTPLQGTRAGAAVNAGAAGAGQKRPPTNAPTSNFSTEKNGNGAGNSARRKGAPTL